jgi:hypothetical protein
VVKLLPYPPVVSTVAVTVPRPESRQMLSPPSAGFARGDQAGLVGQHDGLRAVAQAQLGEDAGDVGLDGGLAEGQGARQFAVGQAAAEQRVMYLNTVYFGHGYYGITAAARGYFGVTADQLSWPQAALLAGMMQAPTAYDPYTDPHLALARRAHVLDRLAATGVLTANQARAYATTPLDLA